MGHVNPRSSRWVQVMLAAYHGHAPLVKLLIQHGADPNCLNDRGQSPLAGAVFKGEAEVIEVCTLHPESGSEGDADELGFA